MKDEQQIRKRLRQQLFRAYQKRAKRKLKVRPENCGFNHASSATFPDGRPFRICGLALDETGEFVGCNEESDAKSCRTFIHAQDKDSVRAEIQAEVVDPKIGPRDYPEIRALAWILEDPELEIPPEPSEPEPEPELKVVPLKLDPIPKVERPWWRRVGDWVRGLWL